MKIMPMTNSFRALLLSFIICVILLLSFIYVKYQYSFVLTPSCHYGFKCFFEQSPPDILFIGSSHTGQGYAPKVIEDKLKKSVYVLAYNGLDAVFMKDVLETLIISYGLSFKKIIIEAYPFNAVSQVLLKDTRLFNESPPELKKKIWHTLNRQDNGHVNFEKTYELWVLSDSISLFFAPFLFPLWRHSVYHGAYVHKQTPVLSLQEFEHIAKRIPFDAENVPALNQAQIAAYVSICDILKQYRISAEFIEVPIPRPVYDHPATMGIQKQLKQLIRAQGLNYFDPVEAGLFDHKNPNYFADWNHLSSLGRINFSAMIAETRF